MNVDLPNPIFTELFEIFKVQLQELIQNETTNFKNEMISAADSYLMSALPYVWSIISIFILILIFSAWNCILSYRIYKIVY